MTKVSGLSPAQEERLDWFIEECAEAIQAASKIKRHGYTSNHPDYQFTDNRKDLETEITQIFSAAHLLHTTGDITLETDTVWEYAVTLFESKRKWFHYQDDIVTR